MRFLVDGTVVGEPSIAQRAGGESATVSAAWSAKRQNGIHTLEVRIDPANTIAELSETNNTGTRTFTVFGSKVQ